MKPGKFDLDLYRGDTYRWRFQLWMDADKTQPTDLAGITTKAEIRPKPMGNQWVVEMPTTVELPNAIIMQLTADASKKLASGKWAWDLQLTYPSGDVVTVLAGIVNVSPDVTDSADAA